MRSYDLAKDVSEIQLLVDHFDGNFTRAGKSIGVGGNVISTILSKGEARKVNVLAARAVLQEVTTGKVSQTDDPVKAIESLVRYFDKTPALQIPVSIFKLLDMKLIDILQEGAD